MRTTTQLALTLALALTGACKWTDFDDLADTTWAHSQEDPDVGSTDYGVAVVGISQGTSGGTLGVLSDDAATFSTVVYDAKGGSDLGPNPLKLGGQQIGAVADNPVFIANPAGDRIAIVERSINGGNFAVVFGSTTAPAGTELASAATPTPPPDGAVFTATNDLVFGAGDTFYTLLAAGGAPVACKATDGAGMPLSIAALAVLADSIWVWTKTGGLERYTIASLNPCTGGAVAPAETSTWTPTGGFMPAGGARMHVVGTNLVLTGHPSTSRSGTVYVVDPATGLQVSTMIVEGLKTSTIFTLDGVSYLVVGIPDAPVNGLAAGEVDVHAMDANGMLDATPALQLHDAQPESGQLFGRSVTTMQFNGKPIIVVGADAEVFAYYRTQLYNVAH